MADYKTEHGFEIKHRSSDPPSPIAGEIWYNTTTQTLKVAPNIAAWSSGGNLPAARASGMYTGTQTANLLAGGYAPGLSNTSVTYDGSSWTAAPNLSENPRRSKLKSLWIDYQTATDAFGMISFEADKETAILVNISRM